MTARASAAPFYSLAWGNLPVPPNPLHSRPELGR
jgi:hypothetical protein